MEDGDNVDSKDGTEISYLSVGDGPAVIVLPGVLSMASDYATFACALAQHFTVHVIERRGRGRSGPQGDDYSMSVEFTLADAPARLARLPPWLMKLLLRVSFTCHPESRQMLSLLRENLREWQEIARLDSSYENYQEIAACVLLLYGGRSDSLAVDLVVKRLPSVVASIETKEFPRLDHFGIERTAPKEVAKVISDFFLK